MILKPGVEWLDMHPSMEHARIIIDDVHREQAGIEATCTSARRPQSPGGSSLHPEGKALDIRTWAFGQPGSKSYEKRVRAFASALRAKLGPQYDVVIEGPGAENPKYLNRPPHVHVEHDPKP